MVAFVWSKGKGNIQANIHRIDYGNCDISDCQDTSNEVGMEKHYGAWPSDCKQQTYTEFICKMPTRRRFEDIYDFTFLFFIVCSNNTSMDIENADNEIDRFDG